MGRSVWIVLSPPALKSKVIARGWGHGCHDTKAGKGGTAGCRGMREGFGPGMRILGRRLFRFVICQLKSAPKDGLNCPQCDCTGGRKKRKRKEGGQAEAKAKQDKGAPRAERPRSTRLRFGACMPSSFAMSKPFRGKTSTLFAKSRHTCPNDLL